MLIVNGTVRFAEGEIDRLREAMAKNIAATLAEEGCEHYSYARDISDPNLLHVSERWRDEAAVEAHMASPHMAEFMATLGSARIEAISIKGYEARFVKTLLGS